MLICTHSVCRALPLDIILLIGKEGPHMVMTENCDELRHICHILMCFARSVKRGLHDRDHNLSLLAVFARKLW